MTDPGDEHRPTDIVSRLRLLSNGLTPRTESDLMRETAAEIVCCLLAAGEDRVYERQWGHHSYHAWLGAQTPAEVAHRMGWEFSPKDKP